MANELLLDALMPEVPDRMAMQQEYPLSSLDWQMLQYNQPEMANFVQRKSLGWKNRR